MQTIPTPDSRLLSALPFLKRGGRCIDVGTDHAYLPIYLIHNRIVCHAMACDINEGPLMSAKEHIALAGMENQIDTFLTDGLHGLEFFDADDILIFGMGGELIANIISHAPHLFDKNLRLILQPMSRQSYLRRFLLSSGFDIIREIYSYDTGKYYTCMLAEYTGIRREITEEEATVGLASTEHLGEFRRGYLEARLASLRRAMDGKLRGGVAEPEETPLVRALEELIREFS